MSKGWAAIVYGRTYHLDFRFITVPHDFTPQNLHWASQHIIATTSKARNLAGSPRWSLFKNNYHCIIGVTCMVQDLIGETVKDNQSRPLYVFVGYATQLTTSPKLENVPAYTASCLDNFKNLYQEIEQVWLVKNYEQDLRRAAASEYYPLHFSNSAIAYSTGFPQLNHCCEHPEQIYLWQNSTEQNSRLWHTSARSLLPTATCLNIKGKALTNSPFLNQSCSQETVFQIVKRATTQDKPDTITNHHHQDAAVNLSLSQKITERAKEDIDLTWHQATKVAIAGKELINQISDWNHPPKTESESPETEIHEPKFGFKLKKSFSDHQDWF